MTSRTKESFDWTPEKVSELKKMWAANKTATEISRMFGGVSRSAILGKIHRMKLPPRPLVQKPRSKTPRASNDQLCAPRVPVDRGDAARAFGEKPCSLMDLKAHQCRWPVGDPKSPDFVFCTADSVHHSNYCDRHAALAADRNPRRRNQSQEETS